MKNHLPEPPPNPAPPLYRKRTWKKEFPLEEAPAAEVPAEETPEPEVKPEAKPEPEPEEG